MLESEVYGSIHCSVQIFFVQVNWGVLLSKQKGPIFSLKWNKKGDYLLTGSCDKTAIVWYVKAEECKQQFDFHSGAPFDLMLKN